MPAAGENFWRFFAFCQPKKHCQILKCEFAYHCILQMEGTLTGVPIVDALRCSTAICSHLVIIPSLERVVTAHAALSILIDGSRAVTVTL